MNEQTKESKFLDAINKYAEGQKAEITREIEDYKNAKIEQATEQGLQDAYELIRDEIAKRKAAIVNSTAKRELDLRRQLYAERSDIEEKVFAEARKRLTEFSKSEDYLPFIKKSAKGIKELFGDSACTVFLAPFDEGLKQTILDDLPNATFEIDRRITIGGIRAYCREMGVTADDTLDSRLEAQKQWFIENSGLEVV